MSVFDAFVLNYLVNSLWQVPLVFVAAWLIARMVRRLGPAEEHRVWCGGLLLAVVLPGCAVDVRALVGEVWQAVTAWSASGPVATVPVTVTVGEGYVAGAVHMATFWVRAGVAAYLGVIVYFSARLLWGLWQTHMLRRGASAEPMEPQVSASWVRYCASFGLEGSEIASVADTAVPMTIGVVRRVLLLPRTWPGSIRAEDVDAAIAHECAHMQRRDFAKNLLYRVLLLPVAYHPATWMMQARVVETREMTCDAMAAEAVEGRERYARSLLRLARSLSDYTQSQNLHAIGIFDANNFERRVMNLSMNRMKAGAVRRAGIAFGCMVLGMGTGASALALRMQVAEPQSAQQVAVETAPQVAAQESAVQVQVAPKVAARAVQVVVRSGAASEAAKTSVTVSQTLALKVSVKEVVAPKVAVHVAVTPKVAVHVAVEPKAVNVAEMSPMVLSPAPMVLVTPVAATSSSAQDGKSMEVSAGAMAGNILSKVTPVYPQEAKDQKIQGAVVLKAIIGKDGTIEKLQVLSGPDELKGSALDAVRQWTYKPYLLNGNPVEVETTITVNYHLAE